jgi:hypothetical protein
VAKRSSKRAQATAFKAYQVLVKDKLFNFTAWKCPRVTAVHKRDEVSIAKNYRPISALPNRSLVFERSLAPQLAEFCESITPQDQFGFVRKCGTADYGALVAMKLQDVLERRLSALLISLDVAGAFDKVWHKSLLAKLKKGGLRGKALELIKSYLFLRFLYVVMAGQASTERSVSCGVPQGGIWSPCLWDVAVNDLSQQLLTCECFNYADDSTLAAIFDSLEALTELIIKVNADMEALRVWGLANNLTFDPGKNKFLVVSKRHHDFSEIDTLVMGGITVKYAYEDMKLKLGSALKIVGFTFDKGLSWSKMISSLASKARSQLGALWRLRSVMDSSNLEIMYKAFVRSIMEYGGLEYMSAAETHLAKLDAVQHSAQKICSSVFEDLSCRREASVFGMLCKMLDGEVRGDLKDFIPQFASAQHNRRGRSAAVNTSLALTDLSQSTSLLQYERSFCGIAPKVFKKIPEELIQKGKEGGWRKIMKKGQRFLCGRDIDSAINNEVESDNWTDIDKMRLLI